jgi:predicted metal-dependent enzyme (double-stranded beta helix superfamily)
MIMKCTHPAFARFVDELTEIVADGDSEHRTTERVAARLAVLLEEGGEFLPATLTETDAPAAMYPLYVAQDRSISVAAAVSNAEFRTSIHDHGVWGVIGIYSGKERELRYAPPVAGRAPVLIEDTVRAPGEVTVCCTAERDVHSVGSGSGGTYVGIQVYGGDIGTLERRAFDPETGEVTTFVTPWQEPADLHARDA